METSEEVEFKKNELNEFNLLIEKCDTALKGKEVKLKSMEERSVVFSTDIKLKNHEVCRESKKLLDL